MHKRLPPKQLSVLEKKPPSNPKYKHVVGTLNTGLTTDKVRSITAREFTRRRDEIHYRISKRQLFELYREYEQPDEEQFRSPTGQSSSGGGDSRAPRIVTHAESDRPEYERPYLLLDVREAAHFERCHLLQARSYPYTMCRRDYMHPEIYRFKNLENHLIILYCDDERISRDVAKTLVDRGSDNVFLLTGGLEQFSLEYPSYCEGQVPSLPSPPQRPKPFAFLNNAPLAAIGEDDMPLTARSSSSRRPSFAPPVTGRLTAGRLSARRGSADDDTRSESGMSTKSNFSVAESIYSRATARKGTY